MASSAACRPATGTVILHVLTVTFLYISPQPHFDLEPDYIARKPLQQRFQLYIVHREILSSFHTRVEYIYVIPPIQTNGDANAEKSPKQPFPLTHVDPHLIHECLCPPHSPPQTAYGSDCVSSCGIRALYTRPLTLQALNRLRHKG